MTNDSGPDIRFGMLVLYVDDLQRSIDFYRLLGLDMPDAMPDRPVAIHRADGFTLIITTDAVATKFDPNRARPTGAGYQQVLEFLVDDDASVDGVWTRLTGAGYTGITAPSNPNGPYATVVQDPDGNVVLVSHDPVTNAG